VDRSGYATFSSLDKAESVERRLAQHYLPRFDDLLRLRDGAVRPLVAQADVTGQWGDAVLALSWELFPSMEVVLALMDDEEFGREIKWYFAPGTMRHVDYKFLIIFVEKSMDVLLKCVDDPALLPAGGRRCLEDGSGEAATVITSKLFCYSFPSDGIVPDELRGRGQELHAAQSGRIGDLAVRDRDLEAEARGRGLEPVMCIDVIAGVRGCLALDGGRLVLALDSPETMRGGLAQEILSIARVQTQVVSDMLSAG
jgi:hypothetical protein